MILFICNKHSLNCIPWVRKEKLAQVRERTTMGDHIFVFGFYFCHWCSFYLWGTCRVFSFMVSLRKNYLCLLSLVIISMHAILSDNILRSYCLNDKNLTNQWMKDKVHGGNFRSYSSVNIYPNNTTIRKYTYTIRKRS